MKKLLITIASTAVAAGALAQGQFQWTANAANGFVQWSTDKATATSLPTGNPSLLPAAAGAPYTGEALHLDFYAAPLGTVLTLANGLPSFTTAWTDVGVNLAQITPTAGKQNVTVNLPGNFTAGADVQLEVVGWTGTATSWAAEAAAPGGTLLGYSGESFNGSPLGALSWDQPTGNPNATPTPGLPGALTTGASGYEGLVLEPVPEPATIALGGLGAAALLFFRRRK
jgi:hypothetical protein